MGTLEADPTEREVVCVRETETRTEREGEVGGMREGEREAERRVEKERELRKNKVGGQEARESKIKDLLPLPAMQFIQGSRTPQGQQVLKDPCGAEPWSFLPTQAPSVRHPKFLSVGVGKRVTLWALRSHGGLSWD